MTTPLYLMFPDLPEYLHYHHRKNVWIKVPKAVLEQPRFQTMPDATKAHVMLLRLLAAQRGNLLSLDVFALHRDIAATDPIDLNGLILNGVLVVTDGVRQYPVDSPEAGRVLRHCADATVRVQRDPVALAPWYTPTGNERMDEALRPTPAVRAHDELLATASNGYQPLAVASNVLAAASNDPSDQAVELDDEASALYANRDGMHDMHVGRHAYITSSYIKQESYQAVNTTPSTRSVESATEGRAVAAPASDVVLELALDGPSASLAPRKAPDDTRVALPPESRVARQRGGKAPRIPADTPVLARSRPATGLPPYSDEYERAWREYPRAGTSSNKQSAWRQWLRRLAEGVEPAKMLDGIARYSQYVAASGFRAKNVETFLGPDRHFETEYTTVARGSAPPESDENAVEAAIRAYEADHPEILQLPMAERCLNPQTGQLTPYGELVRQRQSLWMDS